MAVPSGEIVFLTNPTAGKGKASRARDVAVPRLREAGLDVRSLAGSDADEALELARKAVADGVDALVVCGGDGMVHLAIQALAGTGTPLGIIPAGTGNDTARYFDLPLNRPGGGSRQGHRRQDSGDRPGPHAGPKYFVTVLAAGFDAIVNERANAMTLAEGADALQPRHAGRAAHLQADSTTPSTSTARPGQSTRCSSPSGTGRRFGGGLRITEGADARRRPARRGHHQTDVAGPSSSAPIRGCSRARTPRSRSTSTTASARSPSTPPGSWRMRTESGSGRSPSPSNACPASLRVIA